MNIHGDFASEKIEDEENSRKIKLPHSDSSKITSVRTNNSINGEK